MEKRVSNPTSSSKVIYVVSKKQLPGEWIYDFLRKKNIK